MLRKHFQKEVAADFTPYQGKWDISPNKASSVAEDSFAGASSVKLPERCLISTTVTFEKNTPRIAELCSEWTMISRTAITSDSNR